MLFDNWIILRMCAQWKLNAYTRIYIHVITMIEYGQLVIFAINRYSNFK